MNHLSRIHLGGLLPDIVLSGKFQGFGASVDKNVMVRAEGFEAAEPLADEIGITNLGMLIKVIDSMEDDQLSLTIEERFVVIAARDRTYRLVSSAPRVIGSRIDEGIKDKVLALIPDAAEWHPLEPRFVNGVLAAIRILKAETVSLTVGVGGGRMEVGDVRMNSSEFDLPDFKAETPYSLQISASAIGPVLGELKDFTKAQMCLTGAESIIAIKEGEYTYVISPDKVEAKK